MQQGASPEAARRPPVVRQIYNHTDPELPLEWVDEIVRDFIDTEMPFKVRRLGRAIDRWRVQIIAWHQARVSNGPTEAINNLIQRVKRTAFGFRRFEHHRVRCLLYARGLDWVGTSEVVFDSWPADDWLVEVLARAEVLRERIRRVPDWPATFGSDDLTVALFAQGDWIRSWVGRNARGMLVSFRPIDFEVKYRTGDDDARLAVGFAVGWFLDVSVSLVGTSAHPHFERTTVQRNGGTPGTNDVVYVPRPSFQRDLQGVESGISTPPRAHRVKWHTRKLSDGREPSEEARDRAPGYIRIGMKPNETFVRAHTRGGTNNLTEMTVHLSKYSSLADFMGLARRGNG